MSQLTIYEKWLTYARESEMNREMLAYLVELRNNGVYDEKLHEAYINAGIIGSIEEKNGDEPFVGCYFQLFLDEIGMSLEELGYTDTPIKNFGDGFIIPSWSTTGKFLFCINHNKERNSGLDAKYINLYPTGKKELLSKFRFYGLDSTMQALDIGYMCICEGIFDKLRLNSAGLPAVTTLGSQISKTQLRVLNRFDKCKLVGDNDVAGRKAQQILLKGLARTEQYIIPYEKDIDDLAKNKPEIYQEFIHKMKR